MGQVLAAGGQSSPVPFRPASPVPCRESPPQRPSAQVPDTRAAPLTRAEPGSDHRARTPELRGGRTAPLV